MIAYNNLPECESLKDQEIEAEIQWNYMIPIGTCNDIDNDKLIYQVKYYDKT